MYLEQNGTPFSIPQGQATTIEFSCNRHVFPDFSVVLIQLRIHFYHNVAPFDIPRFNHHFFHFAADFVTLSYTKMVIFPTLSYTASLKQAPLSGGVSQYSPL